MIRRALWWIDDHRVAAALIGLACVAALAAAVVVSSGGGEAQPGAQDPELAAASERAVREVLEDPDHDRPDPDAKVSEVPTIKERAERAEAAGEDPELGGEIEKVPEPENCSGAARGAIVDVTVSGAASCAAVGELVDAYRFGPGGAIRPIDGFTCVPNPEPEVICSRPTDATTVALLFGPGGPGLRDCGQSPIDEAANLARVRTTLSCNAARTRIFAAMSSGEPTAVKGFSCKRGSIEGTATVSCVGGGEALAFTLPKGG